MNDHNEYGAIHDFYINDVDLFMGEKEEITGRIFNLSLNGVPRVKLQEGLFFGALNYMTFDLITNCDRYYFKQGQDSEEFLSDFGFSSKLMLPPLDVATIYPSVSKNNESSFEYNLDKTENLLTVWVEKYKYKPRWEDYYEWSKTFAVRDWLGPNGEIIENQWTDFQNRMLRALSYWFYCIQDMGLPKDATSMRRLVWAAQKIGNSPSEEYAK
ncbi:MAG: hypothetical protein AB2601_20135 [Candidatus Thiodiazotropha sp.]